MRSGFRLALTVLAAALLGVVGILAFGGELNHWHIAVNCCLSVAILAGASAVMLRCLPQIVSAYGMGYRDGMRACQEQHDHDEPVPRRLRSIGRP
jgi:hypothetical protein